MGSSASKFTLEHRQTLYFNRYTYRVTFRLPGSSMARYSTDIHDYTERVNESILYQLEYYNNRETINTTRLRAVNKADIQKLLEFRDKYITNKTNMLQYGGWESDVRVYTSDIKVIKYLSKLKFDQFAVTEAVATVSPEVMLFKSAPKFEFRIYLKDKKVNDAFKQTLRVFLSQYPDIHACSALKLWLNSNSNNWHYNRTHAGHFVEFNHDEMYTLILLYLGNDFIRKHYRLEQRPQ